jgi:hypothetical protein
MPVNRNVEHCVPVEPAYQACPLLDNIVISPGGSAPSAAELDDASPERSLFRVARHQSVSSGNMFWADIPSPVSHLEGD